MSVHQSTAASYDDHGRLLRHTHDSVTNRQIDFPNNPTTLYITGDEDTDGSERFTIDEITGVATIQNRANGIWNICEFQLSQGALLLGRDTHLSAAGHHLIITTPDIVEQSLVLGQEFDDTGSGPPESTILGPLISRSIRQPDNSVELTLTNHSSTTNATGLLLCTTVYGQIGATAASADVDVIFSEGIPPNDTIFFVQHFPASFFPANTEVTIDLSPGLQFDPDVQINGFFTSDNAFTMRYDVTGTFLWFALDLQQQSHEDILTETLVLSNDLSIAFSNAGELVRSNEVFA